MTRRERILQAIRGKAVDRIPLTFRASRFLTIELMRHFGFSDPADFAGNRGEFLDRLGADFWSSGSKVDKFSTFIPAYRGEKPFPPYVDDGTFFYTIGIHSKPGNMQSWDIDYPNVGVDPPLADAESSSDVEKDFLLKKLDLFDFGAMGNKYRAASVTDLTGRDDAVVNIGTLSSLFMMCCYLRGMENFLMDLAFNRKLVERLVGEVGEFVIEFNLLREAHRSEQEEGALLRLARVRQRARGASLDDRCGNRRIRRSPDLSPGHDNRERAPPLWKSRVPARRA